LGDGGIRGSFGLVLSESVDPIVDSERDDDPDPRLRADGGVLGSDVDGGTTMTCSSEVVG